MGDWWFDAIRNNRHDLFWQAHERSHAFPVGAKDLINRMFRATPTDRIAMSTILEHPWVATAGSAVTADAIQAEMLRRLADIRRAKEAEREANRKRREEERRCVGLRFSPHCA
jgi:hypothetical protein